MNWTHTHTHLQDDPEDLTFKKGDIMTVLRKDEDEWWFAKHEDGRLGSIPVPYIQIVSAVIYWGVSPCGLTVYVCCSGCDMQQLLRVEADTSLQSYMVAMLTESRATLWFRGP